VIAAWRSRSTPGALVQRARPRRGGALALGVDVERLKRETFVLGSLLTAIAVAQAGMIGFVGLIVPHLLRLSGGRPPLLLPASAFGGAPSCSSPTSRRARWWRRASCRRRGHGAGRRPFFLVLLRGGGAA